MNAAGDVGGTSYSDDDAGLDGSKPKLNLKRGAFLEPGAVSCFVGFRPALEMGIKPRLEEPVAPFGLARVAYSNALVLIVVKAVKKIMVMR